MPLNCLILTAFLSLTLLFHSSATADDYKNTNRVIIFFGDSLTAGYGLPPEHSYPALLQDRINARGLNFRVVNAGVSGDTTAAGLRRIDWFLREKVDIFILALGANDGLRGLPVESIENNLQALVAKVRAAYPDVVVVIAGMLVPPNMGPEYASKFSAVFPRVAKKTNARLIPFLLEGVAGQNEMNLPDGIHPNTKGQIRVSENVWTVLEPLMEEATETQ